MTILSEVLDYESVRKALDLTLTEAELPNETMMLSVFQGRAEAEMLLRDPHALDYAPLGTAPDAGKWQRVKNATIFLCAAALAPSLPVLVSEQTPDNYRYTIDKWNPAERRSALLLQAGNEIAAYQEVGGEVAPLTGMSACKVPRPHFVFRPRTFRLGI